MTLDDIDEVVALRNHRRKALELLRAARSGTLDFKIHYIGEPIDPFSVIYAQPVRDALVATCREFIAEKERRLAELGVTTEPSETP